MEWADVRNYLLGHFHHFFDRTGASTKNATEHEGQLAADYYVAHALDSLTINDKFDVETTEEAGRWAIRSLTAAGSVARESRPHPWWHRG